MRVGASLTVKDEVELLGRNIKHLRSIGVDHIIACDMGSTDGSFELLLDHQSDEDFWVFRLDDRLNDGFQTWIRSMVALVKSARIDWVIFLDPDEFWLPACGSLKNCVGLAHTDALEVRRFNVPLGPRGPIIPDCLRPSHYGELLLIDETIPDLRKHLETTPNSVWIRGRAEPKVMARPDRIGTVALGGHAIIPGPGHVLRQVCPLDLIIAHLPLTTRERFDRKIANIRELFRVHDRFFENETAWHWRRWLTLLDKNGLDNEFSRSTFDCDLLKQLQAAGLIRSAAEILKDAIAADHMQQFSEA